MIERAEDLYIACGLQPWLLESRVIAQSLGNFDTNDLQYVLEKQSVLPSGVLKPRTPKKQPKDARGALARMSILPQSVSQPPEENILGAHITDEISQPLNAPVGLVSPSQSGTLDPDYLRVQYLETLYISKTSLAYLAKGPLARARGQVHTDKSSVERLLEFYRESIIPTKKLDLKYKESVSTIIEAAKSLKRLEEFADNASWAEPREKAKKKASRKKKMGKDALYPGEDDYIQRCWAEREVRNARSFSADSQTHEQRQLISDLRTRETKMQILFILEVLALQASPIAAKESKLAKEMTVKTEEQGEDTAAVLAKTPTKPKDEPKHKIKDYGSDLETLLDRLCIWYTVGIDGMLDSPEKKDHDAPKPSSGKDQLIDFCADVIIPYYASRLPEQCKMICRKLGGPEVSPKLPKTALNKSASTSRLLPGAAIKQRPRALPRKTLERVLSDDRSMRHASPPILSRSLTAPLLPNLKRETSESSQRPASRGALHKSVSFSNREIDLDANARVQEAKRRKLAKVAEQKKELDAAIAALKKPNRTVAAQGLMDEIENRSLESNTRKQVVHITATPRRIKSRPSSRHELILPPTQELNVSPDDAIIPSSAVRPSRGSDGRASLAQASTKKRAVLFAIHETPARPSPGLQERFQMPVSRLNFSSAANTVTISSDLTLVNSTPASNRLRPDLPSEVENTPMRMNKSMKPVLFTPLKKTDVRVEDAFKDAPIIPADAGKAMDRVMGGHGATEMSVYEALGWNDDYDL